LLKIAFWCAAVWAVVHCWNVVLGALITGLVYDYWMWANRRERRFANWSPFPRAGNLPTILRWYGARIAKSDVCSACGGAARLDIGTSLPQFASDDMSDVAVNLDL